MIRFPQHLHLVGRLKPGVTYGQASAALKVIFGNFVHELAVLLLTTGPLCRCSAEYSRGFIEKHIVATVRA